MDWKDAAQELRDTVGQEGLDAIAALVRKPFNLVTNEQDACPDCDEQRIDWLVWDDEGSAVTCSTCGCVYVP